MRQFLLHDSASCPVRAEYVVMTAVAITNLQNAHTNALVPESNTSIDAEETLSHAVIASR
jgi:hypothetical protein